MRIGARIAVLGMALWAALAACTPDVILPGTRFEVRTPLEASEPVDGQPAPVAPPLMPENQALAIALPGQTRNADWPDRGGNPQHSGPHGALSASPSLQWSVTIGSAESRKNRISAAPVVAGGRVFTMDALSVVSAVSTGGGLQWQTDLAADYDRDGAVSGGGLAADAAAVYATTGFGEVVALQATSGAVIWRQRLDALVSGAPMVAGGQVYVTGRDGSGWALNASDGRVQWQVPGTPASSGMIGSAAPALADALVVFPFTSGQVAALTTADGTGVWSSPVTGQRLGRGYGAVGDVTGDPVVAGGVVYVGTAAGRLAALDAATGTRIWTATQGAMGPPLVAGGSVFVVSDEARLLRLDAGTGAVIWSVEMPYFTNAEPKKHKAIFAHYGPVLAGGRVVVAGSDGVLRLFNPVDGALAGSAIIPGGAASAPALAQGLLFVVSTTGQLHAFR